MSAIAIPHPLRQARSHTASAMVRAFVPADVPAVAALFQRVFPEHGWPSAEACESYFREIFFENPWYDPDLPSWVATEQGRIAGFLGVLPRTMSFRGRLLRAAVGTQLMVAPESRRSLIALKLIKAALAGPQDVSLTDGANDHSRRLWAGVGGMAPLFYSVHWTRLLRPAQYCLSLVSRKIPRAVPLGLAARPAGAIVDAVSARLSPNRFTIEDTELTDEPLTPAAVCANLPELLPARTLQPVYEERALAWLLEQASRKLRHGTLRARAVSDRAGRCAGWFIYYLAPGAVSEVLQIVARRNRFDAVLHRLLADAWRNGATAVRGRLEPGFVQEFSNRHCWFRREGTWTLVHSRDPEIAAAILRGEAFLSRLDGEWWLRFHGG